MKSSVFFVATLLVAAVLIAGCDKNKKKSNTADLVANQEDVDLTEFVTGIDDTTEVAPVEEDDHTQMAGPADEGSEGDDEDMIGGSQGAFLGRLFLNGKETDGHYTVKEATVDGNVVHKDIKAGQEVMLNPGTYDFVFVTKDVVGKPEFTLRDVEIPAGRRIKRDVKMPVGQITLVTGGRCQKKPIKIKQDGATEWIKGKFHTCVAMTLLAGTYEAQLGSGNRAIPISGIQVYDGGIRDVLIRNK